MTAVPNNTLQNVARYIKAELAWMQNSYYYINKSNKKFKNFQNEVGNLGNTVTFDKVPRYVGYAGLVITQQPSVQRLQSLAVTQAFNISSGYTNQQFIFNVEEYMDRFGYASAEELGSLVEYDCLLNFISGVTINDPQNANLGQIQTSSGAYRFFGDGITNISSSGQLSQALANFRAFGAAKHMTHGILPVDVVPTIINTNANQFTLDRANREVESWMLGEFSRCEWFESNLLPIQVAGTIGNATYPNNIMTVVSVNDPTGQNVTQITCTEPTSGTSATAIMPGDMGQFINVSGYTNVRFLTFEGHKPTSLPYQMRFTAQAGTTAGSVTLTLSEPLVWQSGVNNQNCNTPIVAGMQIQVLPTHKAGYIHSGDQMYLAMPELPDERPFDTVHHMDKDSGASIRHYFGSQFGQNNRSYVRDEIHGSTMVPDNGMRLIFPV